MLSKTYILPSVIVFLLNVGVGAAQEKAASASTQGQPSQQANVVVFRVPSPTLVSPVGETMEISGEKTVKFSWKPAHTPYDVYCYLFRIYKEQDMCQKDAVYAEEVSSLHTEIEVPADLFRDGETYTWYIKQVNNAQKLLFSDAVSHTFRVIKK
ncbi:MAG: hypothetical protein A4E56_03472 [Pelotomaculum sp. PtaU1.Bin065]|nr:MAG: hypothetical protein A4E56_03472 [Pelotomaculum sp. PtaU1.Bin065]